MRNGRRRGGDDGFETKEGTEERDSIAPRILVKREREEEWREKRSGNTSPTERRRF